MNAAERQKLIDDMDKAAYNCAGGLAGIIHLHDAGKITLPDPVITYARRLCNKFENLRSVYQTECALDKAKA